MQWICDKDPECRDGKDESLNLCKNAGSCGGNFKNSYGFIFSPSYPENYPDYADCIYTISQSTGTVIRLNILSMDIEYADPDNFNYDYSYEYYEYIMSTLCNYEYLEIRDGASKQYPIIDGYCGDEAYLTFPIKIQTTQENAWMRCASFIR